MKSLATPRRKISCRQTTLDEIVRVEQRKNVCFRVSCCSALLMVISTACECPLSGHFRARRYSLAWYLPKADMSGKDLTFGALAGSLKPAETLVS
jgi:hypothetical protein